MTTLMAKTTDAAPDLALSPAGSGVNAAAQAGAGQSALMEQTLRLWQRMALAQNEEWSGWLSAADGWRSLPWGPDPLARWAVDAPAAWQSQFERLGEAWREGLTTMLQWQSRMLGGWDEQVGMGASMWRQWLAGLDAGWLERRVSAELIHFTDRRHAAAAAATAAAASRQPLASSAAPATAMKEPLGPMNLARAESPEEGPSRGVVHGGSKSRHAQRDEPELSAMPTTPTPPITPAPKS